MAMRPTPIAGRDEYDLLSWWKWIAPAIAVFIFMWMEDGNAATASYLRQSGFGYHAAVAGSSALIGALLGVPVTAVARSAWHLAFGE